MSFENNLVSCSVRIPEAICAQVDKRAKNARRSRNMEIIELLEIALQVLNARDARLKAETELQIRESAS